MIDEVLTTEARWTKAFLEADVTTLEGLMHPDYQQIQSDGSVWGKAQVLASFDRGERHWERAKSDEHRVQLFANVAIVTGRWQAEGINHGLAFDYAARFVSVYVKTNGGWQMVSDQSTPIT
ncbi:MAG: nuclear transport factor 2 family protein [Trueperaceae bacterium]|nr:nuclear transport factor 2 family protein [Trueperaceae bacterium]